MRTPLRTLLLAAGLGIVAAAVPGSAAPAPQIVDAKGDSFDGNASHDVQSVLFSRTSKGFSVVMTLSGPQSTQQGVNYAISATTPDCGTFTINWTPSSALGSRDQITMDCGEASSTGEPYTILNVAPKAKGNQLTWTFNKKSFPAELKRGATFSDLAVAVDPNEPVFGIIGPQTLGLPVRLDEGTGKGSFTF